MPHSKVRSQSPGMGFGARYQDVQCRYFSVRVAAEVRNAKIAKPCEMGLICVGLST